MSKVTHTPGPWTWCGQHDEYGSLQSEGSYILWSDYRSGDYGMNIATYIECKILANARLIAAAPELLEALEKTLHEVEALIRCVHDKQTIAELNAVADQARAAIAKARGEA